MIRNIFPHFDTINGSYQKDDSGDAKPETDEPTNDTDKVEKAKLTVAQEDISKSANEVKWGEQGMLFLLPKGWNKVSENRTMLNYGTPAKDFFNCEHLADGGGFSD